MHIAKIKYHTAIKAEKHTRQLPTPAHLKLNTLINKCAFTNKAQRRQTKHQIERI